MDAIQLGQPGKVTLDEAFTLFKPFVVMEKDYKPATQQHYIQSVKQFIHSCAQRIYADRIDLAIVKAWQLELEHQGLKANTQHVMTEGVRAFVSFLEQQGYIKEPFSSQIVLPDRDRTHHTSPLTPEQYEALLCKAKGNARDVAMLEVLYHTGIRLSELLRLQPEDITPTNDGGCLLSIRRTKGRRRFIEEIVLNARGYKALAAYVAIRPQTSEPRIFLNRYMKPINRRDTEKMVKKYAQASLLPWVHIQSIRRAYKPRASIT